MIAMYDVWMGAIVCVIECTSLYQCTHCQLSIVNIISIFSSSCGTELFKTFWDKKFEPSRYVRKQKFDLNYYVQRGRFSPLYDQTSRPSRLVTAPASCNIIILMNCSCIIHQMMSFHSSKFWQHLACSLKFWQVLVWWCNAQSAIILAQYHDLIVYF